MNKKAFVIALLALIFGGGGAFLVIDMSTTINEGDFITNVPQIDKGAIEEIAISLNCQWDIFEDEDCNGN